MNTPCEGQVEWQETGTVREAQALHNPFVREFQYPHPGRWGASRALFSMDPPNLCVGALKGAETGDALILRLFETHGRPAEVAVTLAGEPALKTWMGAWELKTLRLERDGEIREVSFWKSDSRRMPCSESAHVSLRGA